MNEKQLIEEVLVCELSEMNRDSLKKAMQDRLCFGEGRVVMRNINGEAIIEHVPYLVSEDEK